MSLQSFNQTVNTIQGEKDKAQSLTNRNNGCDKNTGC